MKRHTHRLSHPSLFPLRMILCAAELETPTQPPHPPRDADELMALKLIERIKRPRQASFTSEQIESAQPVRSESKFEMVSAHG